MSTRRALYPVSFFPNQNPNLMLDETDVPGLDTSLAKPLRPGALMMPWAGRVDRSNEFMALANVDPAEWLSHVAQSTRQDLRAPHREGFRSIYGADHAVPAEEVDFAFDLATFLSSYWRRPDLSGVFWPHDAGRPAALGVDDASMVLSQTKGRGVPFVHFDATRRQIEELHQLSDEGAIVTLSATDEGHALVGMINLAADPDDEGSSWSIGATGPVWLDLSTCLLRTDDETTRERMGNLHPEWFPAKLSVSA